MKVLQAALLVMIFTDSGLSQEHDQFNRDTLRVSVVLSESTECRVAVEVKNDQELAGMDIPLRFGQPGVSLNLARVEWSDRVFNFDFKHAEIDNTNKTVILGLIAELGGTHPDHYLSLVAVQDPTIATLVFRTEGNLRPQFSTFTTEEPHHSLTFLYNTLVDSILTVREFAPAFRGSAVEE